MADRHSTRVERSPIAALAGCVLSACCAVSCAFDLGDVRTENTSPDASYGADGDASKTDGDAWYVPDNDGASTLDTGSADIEAAAIDGCWPAPNAEVCVLAGRACGPLDTLDNCGLARQIPSCGTCTAPAQCETGVCVTHTYSWKTSGWSACSQPCGGGTQTRDVWCEREDGTHVADALCAGTKPPTSQGCNQQACCTPYCVPHDACGSDGCGGDCGTCVTDRYCHNGYCVWDHGNDGTQTCSTICAWGSSTCVDTSVADCATKTDTECYCW